MHGLYLLTPAMNGSEALLALERSVAPYDLLLCDQRLPDMCGIELIETASQRRLIQQAVLFSGLDASQLLDIEQSAKRMGLPLLGCLDKPLNPLALMQLLSSSSRDC